MTIREGLAYDDVLLIPQYSEIKSRKTIDLSVELPLLEKKIKIPIISSPMDTITENEMMNVMNKNGSFGILHRYNTIEKQISILKRVKGEIKAAAIGIVGDYCERAQELIKNGVNILCLDVAHGQHMFMKHAMDKLRKYNDIHIMAGNVATLEGYKFLHKLGVDSVRVGIGGGSICSTRIQTGHGVPMITSLLQIKGYKSLHYAFKDTMPLIVADGGIKNSGDCVKAFAAGADLVMCGSMFSGTKETPGKVYEENGFLYKIYRGMASKEAMKSGKKDTITPEGIVARVPYIGKSAEEILIELAGGIRSGLSYSGVHNIRQLQIKAQFIKQTLAGQFESSTHILNKK